MSKEPDAVVVRGCMRTIEYAVSANGKMPAKNFIEGLRVSDQTKIDVLFDRMAKTGKISNREQFKQIADKIYEFKRFQTRIGCFQIHNRWILTHGFIKKSTRWPNKEIKRARRIREEHLAREDASKKTGRQRK